MVAQARKGEENGGGRLFCSLDDIFPLQYISIGFDRLTSEGNLEIACFCDINLGFEISTVGRRIFRLKVSLESLRCLASANNTSTHGAGSDCLVYRVVRGSIHVKTSAIPPI